MMRRARVHPSMALLLVACLAAGTGACGDDDTPTAPTEPTAAAVEVYTGTLSPRGTGFYSFQATGAAAASFTLASLTNPTTGRPVDASLTIGLGVPAGEGCNVSSSTTASPGLSAQFSVNVTIGTYCVQVSDPGSLTAPVNFAVRIRRP